MEQAAPVIAWPACRSWQFVTQPEYAPWLRALVGINLRPPRLSQPALETLAIIAYRQPIVARRESSSVRGVTVDGVMQTLWSGAGRAKWGAPRWWAAHDVRTTALFLSIWVAKFGSILPAADELRRIVVKSRSRW